MARTEVLYDGCCVHVISRSIRKLEIFKGREDFETFCALLIKLKKEHGWQVFHYCLMNTHFHLALRISTIKMLIRGMQKLKSRYAYKFHSRYKMSGPIWKERFRSLLIENETYLHACGLYIENNPVRAGLVREREEWKYSSSRYYSLGAADEVVDGYESNELPELPIGTEVNDENIFEKGAVIGSAFYRFQFKDVFKRHRKSLCV